MAGQAVPQDGYFLAELAGLFARVGEIGPEALLGDERASRKTPSSLGAACRWRFRASPICLAREDSEPRNLPIITVISSSGSTYAVSASSYSFDTPPRLPGSW